MTLSRNTWYAKWDLRLKVLFWMYIYTQWIIYCGCGYSTNATYTPRSTKAMAYQHKNYHYKIWCSHGDLNNKNAIPEMMVFILKWAPNFGIMRLCNSLIICDEVLTAICDDPVYIREQDLNATVSKVCDSCRPSMNQDDLIDNYSILVS